METSYLENLKHSLAGADPVPLVFLCNFEVERKWARNYVGLPAPGLSTTAATVQRMEELGALLAGHRDVLCLSRPIDPGFRTYAESLGFHLPAELVVEGDPAADTSDRILASPAALDRLRRLAESGARLLPMGTSVTEQKIADTTGLPLVVSDADTMERVNGKIYGRRISQELGLRSVPGESCETVDELATALDRVAAAGPAIVKEAYGVSGKGQVVVDSPAKGRRLLRMVQRRAARTGSTSIHVVVERFLATRFDLNYQLTVDRSGTVTFDFVKEAMTAGGVHLGHVMPAELSTGQHAELREAAQLVGRRLHADGFTGVAGVDAILGEDGTLYPVLEINARLNMSTYQGGVVERLFKPGGAALARHYPLRLEAPLEFERIRSGLGPLVQCGRQGPSVVITCFGTVNAEAPTDGGTPAGPFDGRLYTMLFAGDRAGLSEVDAQVTAALAQLTTAGGIR